MVRGGHYAVVYDASRVFMVTTKTSPPRCVAVLAQVDMLNSRNRLPAFGSMTANIVVVLGSLPSKQRTQLALFGLKRTALSDDLQGKS